jgi:hypothetical protein
LLVVVVEEELVKQVLGVIKAQAVVVLVVTGLLHLRQ